MSRIVPILALTALAALLAGPGGAQTSSAAQTSPAEAASPANRILTPLDDSSRNVKSVAESPLSDLNLVRQKIPPILQRAVDDPYAPVGRLNCRVLGAEIMNLYEALGRDFDDPPTPSNANVARSSGPGLRLMHNAAQWLIPYDGFVRTLSGAQRRDQRVLDAINAGDARRAYLKGLGEARGCPAPASPAGHGRLGSPRPRHS